MAPVEVFSVRPAGNVPLATEKVYPPEPPVAVRAGLLNGTPTVPEVTAGHETEGATTMVKLQLAEATPLESFAWMLKVPAAVGVPVIAPVEVFSVRPAGNVPLATENVYVPEPPLAVRAGLLNGTLTSPEVVVGQETVTAELMMKAQAVVATPPFESFT
jgi:hypothetical protein